MKIHTRTMPGRPASPQGEEPGKVRRRSRKAAWAESPNSNDRILIRMAWALTAGVVGTFIYLGVRWFWG